MFKWIEKIKLVFSCTKVNSPINKPSAKSLHGTAIANNGDSCAIQTTKNGDIINCSSAKETLAKRLESSKAFNNLKEIFTKDGAQKIINNIEDPRFNADNIKTGNKNAIKNNLEKLYIGHNHSKTKVILEINEKASQAVNAYIKSANKTEFQKKWSSCYELLVSIKDD